MKYLSCLLLIFAGALQAFSTPPETIDLNTAVVKSSDPNSPVGIWQFGGDGAIFEIRPQSGRNGVYDLYLIESPDPSVRSGVLFGHMTATGHAHNYDVTLYQSLKGKKANLNTPRTKTFIFSFEPLNGTVSVNEYKSGTRVSILRWVPYLFRLAVDRSDSRPRGIDGARRISPPSPVYPVVL